MQPDGKRPLRKQKGTGLVWLAIACVLCAGCASNVRAQAALTLHEAVQQAISGPAAEVASAQVEEARGAVRQAGLAPNPRLYLQSEDLRPWASNFDFPTQTEDYGYVGQTIELDGKRSKRVSFAKAKAREAEATRDLQMRQIAGRVTAAYWNAVGLERISALLQEDMRAVDEMVRYHKQRVDAGAMRGVDLLRMEIERDRLELALAGAERDAERAKLELFRQMGRPAMQVTLSDPLEAMPVVAPADVANVLQTRPDVVAAREAVTAAENDLKLQKANAIPDPDFFAGYKRNAADNTAYGGLQVSIPVRNRNQGEIQRAQASVAGARASLTLLEQQVRVEVDQARANYDAQQKVVRDTLPRMRAHAQQNLQIIAEAYRIGGVDLLRFIDAERTEFDVEVSAVHSLMQLQQVAVQLQLAYGVQP